jgi:sec-independent protein translocase protein TatB
MRPRAALTKHLLDGDDSWLTGEFDKSTVKGQSAAMPSAQPAPDGAAPAQPASAQATPSAGAAAPFDSDAT